MLNSIFFFNINDTPKVWGISFQNSATPQMEGLVELHDNIMFYLVIILFGVGWIMVSIVINYIHSKSPISHKYLNHGTLIELIWTITPALILILIAFPSFKLLYLMNEISDPAMSILAEGHQWYWSYQYPDFLNIEDEFVPNNSMNIDDMLNPKSPSGSGNNPTSSDNNSGNGGNNLPPLHTGDGFHINSDGKYIIQDPFNQRNIPYTTGNATSQPYADNAANAWQHVMVNSPQYGPKTSIIVYNDKFPESDMDWMRSYFTKAHPGRLPGLCFNSSTLHAALRKLP